MLHATFASLLARKLRLLLSAASIVLGVSFVAGALVLTDSLGRAFDDLFSSVGANVAADVRGTTTRAGSFQTGDDARRPVPVSTLGTVRGVDGVAEAQPGVTGIAELVGRDGEVVGSGGAPTFGLNWVDSPALGVGHLVSGRAPRGGDEIVVNRSLAEDAGYSVGDTAGVLTDAPEKAYRIVGIAEFAGGQGSLGGATNVFFDTATAQRVFGRSGSYDEITVAAESGVTQAELTRRVRGVLPAGVEAITGKAYADEQAGDVKDGLAFFTVFLLIFAAIALFVGAFIIVNTFSMLVAQRTRELALMRALGASRGQVTRSVLLEAVVVGLISSVLGLAAGIGVAKLLTAVFEAAGAQFPSGPTVVAVRTVVVSFVVGVLVTSLAALLPARRASKVPPIAAMREAATPDRSLTRQTLAGSVLLVAGAAAMAGGLRGSGLWLLGIGVLIAFIGVTLLSPLISRPVVGAIGALFARSMPGRLGRQNAVRNPRRTASTAAALMVGLALISAVSVLGASLKSSAGKVVNGAITADVLLNVQGPGFPDAVVTAAARTSGVAAAVPVKGDGASVDGKTVFVTALTPDALGPQVSLARTSGSAQLGADTLLMGEKAAKDRGFEVGDRVPVRYAKGSATLTLGGTYATNQLVGDYLVSTAQAHNFSSQRNLAGLVSLSDGASEDQVRPALERAVAAYPNVEVEDRAEFVGEAEDQVDQVVTLISILLLLSVVIAILGVVNTLALSVIERTRELGLLRAIGMSRRQVRRMVRVESVVISVFGGLLGLVVGAVFGVALQRALVDQGVTALAFPVGTLLIYLAVAAAAGVAAAWLPARRASRLDVLAAVATS